MRMLYAIGPGDAPATRRELNTWEGANSPTTTTSAGDEARIEHLGRREFTDNNDDDDSSSNDDDDSNEDDDDESNYGGDHLKLKIQINKRGHLERGVERAARGEPLDQNTVPAKQGSCQIRKVNAGADPA